ncbi:MAG: hypothetical protein OEX23_01795 [Betaproteobacteria bacterium]|jgi:hypothetical protein|nr:hypothetical protein [Betaproteobacteria bacterium]
MRPSTALLVAAVSALFAGALSAQTVAPAAAPAKPAAAAPAAAAKPAAAAPVIKAAQPGLIEVSGPRVNEVVAAGIQKITAVPGKGNRSIQVQSPWGASRFDWPKNVKQVAFTIETGKPKGGATITAPGFTEANKADYQAAIDAVVPVAIKMTTANRSDKQHGQVK